MTWPTDKAICYGVCCHMHGTCQRYAAVDGNTNERQVAIDHCGPEYSLYIPILPVADARALMARAAA